MPEVLNRRGPLPVDLRNAVYVGRPSKWGNPFSHLSGTLAQYKVESRDEAVSAHRWWFLWNAELVKAARRELRGKDLICWCKPKSCHADILLEVANAR